MTTVEGITDEKLGELLHGIAVRPSRAAVDWLVPGLIHPGITVVTGQPERGKTTLLATLCAAAMQGTDWLGKPTYLATDKRILFLAEDDTSVAMLDKWLNGIDTDGRVHVWRVEQWESIVNFGPVVTEGNFGLVIVDSAYGAAGDVNDQARANVFVSSLQTIEVPVVVVHHEPKNMGSAPAGAQRFRAAYRHTLRVKGLRSLSHGQVAIELEVSGNDVPGKTPLRVLLDRFALTAEVREPAEKVERRAPARPGDQARILGQLAKKAAVPSDASHTAVATALLKGGRDCEDPDAQAAVAAAIGLPTIRHQALSNRIKSWRTEFDTGYREGSGGW